MSREVINLLKFLVIGLLAFGLWASFNVIMGWRTAAKVNAASVEQANRTGAATTDIAQGLPTAQAPVIQAEQAASTSRVEYVREYHTVRTASPDVAAILDSPVDQRLRDAARARRESRERLGGVQGRDQGTREAP